MIDVRVDGLEVMDDIVDGVLSPRSSVSHLPYSELRDLGLWHD